MKELKPEEEMKKGDVVVYVASPDGTFPNDLVVRDLMGNKVNELAGWNEGYIAKVIRITDPLY